MENISSDREDTDRGIPETFSDGVLLIGKGKFADAIRLFEEILRIEPRHVEALYQKGVALGLSGKYLDSDACFDQVLSILPAFSALRN